MDGAYSEWRLMLAGVPQGSVVSPILCTLYTSDLPRYGGKQVAMYKDDICIYVKDKCAPFARAAVQRHLIVTGKLSKKWSININENKSAAVVFSRTGKPIYVESRRYLGEYL